MVLPLASESVSEKKTKAGLDPIGKDHSLEVSGHSCCGRLEVWYREGMVYVFYHPKGRMHESKKAIR